MMFLFASVGSKRRHAVLKWHPIKPEALPWTMGVLIWLSQGDRAASKPRFDGCINPCST